jgi:hypothetical protein
VESLPLLHFTGPWLRNNVCLLWVTRQLRQRTSRPVSEDKSPHKRGLVGTYAKTTRTVWKDYSNHHGLLVSYLFFLSWSYDTRVLSQALVTVYKRTRQKMFGLRRQEEGKNRQLGPRTSRPVSEDKSARQRGVVGPYVKTTRTVWKDYSNHQWLLLSLNNQSKYRQFWMFWCKICKNLSRNDFTIIF